MGMVLKVRPRIVRGYCKRLVNWSQWQIANTVFSWSEEVIMLQRYQDLLTQRFVIILLKSTMRRRSNVWFLIFRVSLLSKGLDLHSALKFTNVQNFLFYSIFFLFLRARYVHQRNPYNWSYKSVNQQQQIHPSKFIKTCIIILIHITILMCK